MLLSKNKLFKYLLQGLLALFCILILCVLLLHIPIVQQTLTQKLANYLQVKLKTEVKIQAIRLKLPQDLSLQGVYIEDRERDTFLNVEALDINFKLNQLLHKKIQFDKVTLHGGIANIFIEKDSANYDFILEAFQGEEVEADTQTKQAPTTENAWKLTFDEAGLAVHNVAVHYISETQGIDLQTQIGNLNGQIRAIDYINHNYDVRRLHIANSDIQLEIQSVDNEEDTTDITDSYFVNSSDLQLENIDFRWQQADLELQTNIGKLIQQKGYFKMVGDSIGIAMTNAKLENSSIQYDIPTTPDTTKGFDINHFQFEEVTLDLSNFSYDNLNINTRILEAKARDKESFVLENLKTELLFSPQAIHLENLEANTNQTAISSQQTIIQYPFFESTDIPIEQLNIQTDLNLSAQEIGDFQYFYPPLQEISFLQKNGKKSLHLVANLNGSLQDLAIEQFDFNGFSSILQAKGRIHHPLQFKQIQLNLPIVQLQAKGELLTNILPDSTLPDYVQLPDAIIAEGNVIGNLQLLKTNFLITTHRQSIPTSSKLKANASFQNLGDLDSVAMQLQLDTFTTYRNDLLAYLPKDAIPDYAKLPDEISLTGEIKGPFSNLTSNLQLLTLRNQDQSSLHVLGNVSDLFTSKHPRFDLNVELATLSQEEIAALLPDSLLPAYFQLPLIKKLKGVFKGEASDFTTQFQLTSNAGDWEVKADLKEEKYQLDVEVEDFNANAVFAQNYLNSLVGISPTPFQIQLQLEGNGFSLSDTTFADFLMTVKDTKDTNQKGLILKGKLEQQKLTAQAVAEEEAIQLRSNLHVDNTKELPVTEFDLQLDKLDLEVFNWSKVPFKIAGKLVGKVEGMNLDTLNGQLAFEDIQLNYQNKKGHIDSLHLLAKLDKGKNKLQINSDFLDAQLQGIMVDTTIMATLQQYIDHLYLPEASDSLMGKTDEYFSFDFHLHRPEILTMGWIEGLEELTPFQLQGKWNNPTEKWEIQSAIPYLRYQNMAFENIDLQLSSKERIVNYDLSIQKSDIQGVAYIENAKTFGQIKDQTVGNTLQLLDENQQKRFDIQSEFAFLPQQQFQFSLLKDQLLNYENWTVTEDNFIRFGNQKIAVNNWRFFKDRQLVVMQNFGDESLQLAFEQFDLATISNILKFNANYFSGILDGQISVNDLFQGFYFNTDLAIDSLKVFDALLGNLILKAKDESKSIIAAEATLKGNGNELSLQGKYDLNSQFESLDFLVDIPKINLEAIEPLTFGYLEKMTGELQGKVQVQGSFNSPSLTGSMHFKETAFDIEMLKSRWHLGNQPIEFDANVIEFKDIEVFDANNQKGILSSYLTTNDYRDFFLDADFEIRNFQILNTTAKDNDLYYGKLLTDAKAKLSGRLQQPRVNITAKPKKGSKLTYIYNPYDNEYVSHEGIVEFISPDTKDTLAVLNPRLSTVSNALNMTITAKLEINEDLEFKAITDPLTGDFFKGTMKGDLVYVQLPDESMQLTGSLEAVSGKYLFTYQDVIRRPFKVEPGGTLTWTGDPFNPKLSLDVNYQVRASTYPLIAGQRTREDAATTGRQNFVVQLHIDGVPSKTEIKTSIEYPQIEGNTGDSNIQSAINRINKNPSQQNTQAFSLILFNGFIAQNIGQSQFQVVDLSGNINSIITSQLNGLANRYIKFVELDFGIDSYNNSDNNSQTDFKVSIRKRFLNDRLVINLDGKTSTESGVGDSRTQTYLDNVTIEYALTPEGQFKIKIYNARDYNDFIGGTGVKVGGALVFSKAFDRIRFKKK